MTFLICKWAQHAINWLSFVVSTGYSVSLKALQLDFSTFSFSLWTSSERDERKLLWQFTPCI